MIDSNLIYSLVIPCYNEADNLPKLINRCDNLISTRQDLEVILVNNGSIDSSAAIFSRHIDTEKNARLRVVTVEKNQGYGYGIVYGLHATRGMVIGWTHADLQTDPADFLRAINLYESLEQTNAYIKGKRKRRSLFDQIFTTGMTFFEYGLLGHWMDDINAQPNLFSRSFFKSLESPPKDFSLDLYFFFSALEQRLPLYRFEVVFGSREHGVGNNENFISKICYSLATIQYSLGLKKSMKDLDKKQIK
jgi:glycosyltransferase involved in cell wall biosynthesis